MSPLVEFSSTSICGPPRRAVQHVGPVYHRAMFTCRTKCEVGIPRETHFDVLYVNKCFIVRKEKPCGVYTKDAVVNFGLL